MTHSITNRMLMFLMLSNECEKFGLSIKGEVRQEFKLRLNHYLEASKMLQNHCKQYVIESDMDDVSESFSRVIESLMGDNKGELLALISAYFNGEIVVTS